MITIDEGNVYQSVATFTDSAGAPVVPSVVEFVYELNGDATTKTVLTYAGSTLPEPGIVAMTSPGVFCAQVSLAAISGTVRRYWVSTGTGQAASTVDTVAVPPLPF